MLLAAFRDGARVPVLAAWSTTDKGGGITLSGSNLIATCNTTTTYPSAAAVRSTLFTSDDHSQIARFYWEYFIADTGTYCTVGVASGNANLANHLGSQSEGWGLRNNGQRWNNDANTPGVGFDINDYVGVALDKIAGALWFSVNGTWVTGDPAAGTDPAFQGDGLKLASVRPVISLNVLGDQVQANFGQAAFEYPVPAGFRPGFGLGV